MELFNTSIYKSLLIGDREAVVSDKSWNTSPCSVESVGLSLASSCAEQTLKLSSLSKSTEMRSQFLILGLGIYQYIRTSVIIFLRETLTYLQLAFLVLELRLLGTAVDCCTKSQPYGLKRCAASMPLDPGLSSLNSLAALSVKDYEQYLEDSEWQDILLKLKRSRQVYSALRKSESEYSLLATPTTYCKGSGNYRPAGSTRLEQKLRSFIYPSMKLNPGVPGWMMGFPVGWTELVLLDGGETISAQRHIIQELGHICPTAESVTICTPEVSAPSKRQCPSKESVTSTHLRQGSLAPFLETKKLKCGVVTYPKVNGVRDRHNFQHWRWGFYYEVKVGGIWCNRSKAVTAAKAVCVRRLLDNGASCDRILEFLN